MMKLAGIIAEYNPMHNGHIYHINKTKELTNCDGVIAIISGNFNQRGIPSVIDKYEKTLMALNNGIDLVLELPTIYAVSSAEFFAFGAISLLNNLNMIDSICFGSEYGSTDILYKISEILTREPKEFKELLRLKLDEGSLFPTARSYALEKYFNQYIDSSCENISSIVNSSNNILGIEYIKSILRINSPIKSYTIKREGSNYNDQILDNKFSSATSIRNSLMNNCDIDLLKNHIPNYNFERFKHLKDINYDFTFDFEILPFIKYKCLTNPKSLENIPDVSEGIHNKIEKSLLNNFNYYDVLENIKSKRYTLTRISRILCQYFIGFDTFNCNYLRTQPCSYAKILGMNTTGKKILKLLKSTSSIPLYTKLPKTYNNSLSLDLQASKAYSLINNNYRYNEDFLKSPIILNNI